MKRFIVISALLVSSLALVFAGGARQQAAGGKTKIKVWHTSRHDLEFMTAKVEEYNRTNTDNIEVEYIGYTDNYHNVVELTIQTNGELPDILADNGFVNNDGYGDYFLDLNTVADAEFKEFFKEGIAEGYTVKEGKWYSLPDAGSAFKRLFWNKDIFRRVGLSAPPESLEQMVEYAKLITDRLKSEGIYGYAQNMKGVDSALARSLERSIELYVQPYDRGTGKWDFVSGYECIKYWKQLLSPEIAFPGCESLDIDPLRAQFADGKIGMYCSYSHAEPGVYTTQFPTQVDWGTAFIPVPGGKIGAVDQYGVSNKWMITAKSKNIDAAWKVFRNLFYNPQLLKEYYDNDLGVPYYSQIVKGLDPKSRYVWDPILTVVPGHDAQGLVYYDGTWSREGPNEYAIYAEIIYGNYTDTQARALLQDLTDRTNKGWQEAQARGELKVTLYRNYDPLHPEKAVPIK
jgi:multiple sugar transport system substrate-binding protein